MSPLSPNPCRALRVALILWWSMAGQVPSQALAQASELEAATEQAMEAYLQLEIDRALELLEHALARAEATGVPARARAEAYVQLGILYVEGLDDADSGANAFREALLLAPEVEPDPNLSTPRVQRVFAHAELEAEVEAERRTERKVVPPPLLDEPAEPPAGVQAYDAEVPSAKATETGDDEHGASRPRGFMRLGFALAGSYVGEHASADRQPPQGLQQDQFAAQNWNCPRDDSGSLARSGCEVGIIDGGLVPTYALRAELGWHATERLVVSATLRAQLDAGQGPLAHSLLGLRLGYQYTEPRSEGLHGSLFVTAMVGQIQPQPGRRLPDPKPYVKSGPFGVGVGTSIGHRFSSHLGLYLTPELIVLFPNALITFEASLGPSVWW